MVNVSSPAKPDLAGLLISAEAKREFTEQLPFYAVAPSAA